MEGTTLYPLENLTIANAIERSANLFSSLTALSIVEEQPITYSQLKKNIEHLSSYLKEQGINSGDRVAILGENSPQWGTAYLSITTMGAISVPILPDFHTNEVHHILRHSSAKVLFVSERFFYKIESLRLSDFNCVILLDDFSLISPDTPTTVLQKLITDGRKELKKIMNYALRLTGIIGKGIKEDDVASIIYTSGTTGHSKGVMLTNKNIVSNAIAVSKIITVNQTDRFLSILPLAHVYECTLGLVTPLMFGSAIYYLKKPPTAAVLVPALSIVKPTIMLSVPLIIEKMYKTKILPTIKSNAVGRFLFRIPPMRRRISKLAGKKLRQTFGGALKLFCIGGAPLNPEVERFLREAEFPYAIGYGLTETSPLVTGTDVHITRFRSAGKLIPGVEMKIDKPDMKTGTGEVLVRGETVMKGYYHDPERTSEVIMPDGWFRTGDLGYIDRDGYLFINGRVKNMILGPNGENIYPEAIESVIDKFDDVLESLVFQQNGVLMARVHLDYEKLDLKFSEEKLSDAQSQQRIEELLENLLKQVNDQVSSFSRLAKIIEQPEPFEKTPTQKIKRHLYAEVEK
jgi:long-chain acyl-CoA synthetase